MTKSKAYNERTLRSIKEASEHIGIKQASLKHLFYNVYNQKQPQPTKLGNRLYFTTEALDKFIDTNTQTEV